MPATSLSIGKDPDVRGQIDALIAKYASLSPEEKRELSLSLSQLIGGTGGAIAGGLLGGPPGAVLGAGLGGATGYASFRAGETIESSIRDQPLPPITTAEDLKRMAWAGLEEAAGEGIGRAIPGALRFGKTAATNILRKPFQPTAATKKLTELADQYGIPLNVAQRSGREWLFMMQGALERLPFASQTIRDSYLRQYRQWEGMMNKLLEGVRAGNVSEAEFAEIAESSIRQLRDEFAVTMNDEVMTAAAKISPEPVSLEQAGRALQEGLDANRLAVSKWAKEAYGGLRKQYGKTPVDLSPLAESAKELLADIPEDQWKRFFPGGTLSKLQAAAGATPKMSDEFLAAADDIAAAQAGAKFDQLDSVAQERIKGLVKRIHGLTAEPVPEALTFAEALQLRSSLIKSAGRISREGDTNSVRLLHGMADGVTGSMEKAFADTPDVLSELSNLNRTYREKMRALYPPSAAGKEGNPQASKIFKEDRPERLPRDIAGSPTAAKETELAVSPSTTADITSGPPLKNRLPEMQRSFVDEAARTATEPRQDAFTSYISPSKFGEQTAKVAPEAYGPFGDVVQQPSREVLQAREKLLMRDPFAKAAARETTGGTMRAAFPMNDPRQAERTLGLLSEAGQREAGQRAFGDDLLEQSKTASREMDIRFVNPRTLERRLEDFGPTTPAVLGEDFTGQLGGTVDLGKTLTRAEIFQPSGTAKALEALQAAKEGGKIAESVVLPMATGTGFWKGLGVAGKKALGLTGLPYAAAKGFTNPNLADWLTKSAEPLSFTPGGAAWGAAGRLGLQSLPPMEQPTQNDWLPASASEAPQGDDWLPASAGNRR